jgi:hypothetical protein
MKMHDFLICEFSANKRRMNQVKKRLLTTIFILLLMVLLNACVTDMVLAEAKVESISVDGMQQYFYFVGDELNLETAVLYVQYNDGNIDQIPVTSSMVDPSFSTDKPGVISVKINYKNVSTSFNIEVLDLIIKKVQIGSYPTKNVYIEGTDFVVDGGTIIVEFEGGRTITMPILDNNVTHYDPNIVGPQTVKITYRTESLDIPITVVPKQLIGISVKTPPTNKAVYVGHDINPMGMVITFHYNNGKTEDINQRLIDNLSFEFDNTRATPSTDVKLTYTKYPENQVFTTTFKTQVLYRKYKSMRIIQYPQTNGILLEAAQYDEQGNLVRAEVRTAKTSLQNIIQGDTIDLSSGIVEVTFDDGTTQNYVMSDNLLKVYNVQSTEKSEIRGLTIEPLEKKDVPVGDCMLDYNIRISDSLYDYDTDPEIKITATDKSGAAVAVIKSGERSLIEVRRGEVYTVTITASVNTVEEIDGVNQQVIHVTAKSFRILAEDAVEPRRTLDISSAGDYELTVIYMEDPSWSIPLNVKVVSRAPVSMELMNYGDVTDKEYIVGDKVNISFIKYRMIYDNGDRDPWAAVEARMLSPDVTLECTEATSADNPKLITFSLFGVESIALNVTVLPLSVVYIELEPPTNVYVAQGALINPAGGIMTAYMNNKTKMVYALGDIVGTGIDKAQILNDEESDGNSMVREQPYKATLVFKGASIQFDYYVADKLVESLQLVRDGTEKTTYFQNQPLDFRGLSLRVRWRNSNITDTIPVTAEMLYRYDPYQVGPQTLRFRYKGVVNESFSIIVIPKQVIEVSILQNPKTLYVYGVDNQLDLTGIRINKRFNDGSNEEQIGITLQPDGSGSYGWSYNKSSIDFRRYGEKQTVVLSYRDYYNQAEPITVSYQIEVILNTIEAIYLTDPDDPSAPPSDLIATVSKGMKLNLVDKYIYVKFKNVPEIRVIPLTDKMINYEESDITLGDREVTITYNNATKKAYVRVLDSVLQAVILEDTPKINYMLKEKLDLTGGTVRRIFRYTDSEETWWDIMPMLVEGITISGFDESLSEEDYAADEDFKTRMITITYMGLTYSYNIKIYKKINAKINYYSTISFYGDVSMPYSSVDNKVAGFEDDSIVPLPGKNTAGFALPQIGTYYINLHDILPALPEGFSEELTLDDEGNIRFLRYTDGSAYFIKLVLANGAVGYINEQLIMTSANYPTTPPQNGNKYFILVRVEGNRYYNAINYAQQEFRIINKFINVITVVPNKDAVVWRFHTSDNGRAVYLVSNYIEQRMLSDGSLNMILASPTYNGFEVILTRWGSNDLNAIKDEIVQVMTNSWWSYTVPYTDGSGNPVYDNYGNPMVRIYEIQQSDMPQFPDAIQKKVELLDFEQVIGVNYRTYGEGTEVLSYYVPSGGLIAVRDAELFFAIELFSGYVFRSNHQSQDVMYSLDNTPISGFDMEEDILNLPATTLSGYETRIDLGAEKSLINPNYFINFEKQNYIIAPKEIIEVVFQETASEKISYNGKDYYVVVTGGDGTPKRVQASFRDVENGALKAFQQEEIRYYRIVGDQEIALERGEYPTASGLYRARITHNFKAKTGFDELIEWECLLQIT